MKFVDYIAEVKKEGTGVLYEGKDYFWMNYEKQAAARSPAFILKEVKPAEINNVFKILSPVFITYNIEGGAGKENNAFLYVSTNRDYSLETLDKNGRRFTRTALKNFEFEFVDWDRILKHGYRAFADTRTRNGLSDGTQSNFENIFNRCKRNPAFKTIAAVKPGDENIYAFLQIIEVEDWVEITSSYSRNDSLKFCPNNGLFDAAFNYYLKENRASTVSYGLSSIQKASKSDSLHEFKLRIGFDAKPVRREFIVNPKYRLLINKFSHSAVKLLLKIFPQNRRINKLEGVMDILTEKPGDKG